MRVCLVYDCLFPHTVGGAERWYRDIALRLAADGHEVTYLTLRQWDKGTDPGVPGVKVVPVGPRMALYAEGGRRRILPPIVFGLGVLWHLLWCGHTYRVVHTASFPYFSLLAAGALRPINGYRLVVDWHEVWSREYWRDYLGPVGGWIGWKVQRLCMRFRQRAFCPSHLQERRLVEEGYHGETRVLDGRFEAPPELPAPVLDVEPRVVFAGRHIPEKRVPLVVEAVARAREQVPDLRATIFGDGPEYELVKRRVTELGLDEVVSVVGFVGGEVVEEGIHHAMALVLPSVREGYGLVVVEAASLGTPSVVVVAPDNAATELVEEGVNGTVAPTPDPDAVAEAIVRVHQRGAELRRTSAEWYDRNAERLALHTTLDHIAEAYAG